MCTMKNKYYVGSALVIGKMVAKPDNLSEFDEKTFFELIDEEQPNSGLDMKTFLKETRKMSNLKKGITIGNQYFIYE